MDLLYDVAEDRGLAVMLITHDLGIVAGFAERVVVMYSGRKVQEDAVDRTFTEPAHPYAAGLIGAVPRLDRRVDRMVEIPGAPPHPGARPSGCAYHPRCPQRFEPCSTVRPELLPLGRGGSVACHLYREGRRES